MYDASDPRSALASAAGKPNQRVEDYAGAELIEFHKIEPVEQDESQKTWYGRGQNFVLSYSEVEAGAVLERDGQPDEYMALLPDTDAIVDFETENGAAAGVAYKLAIIPPGDSTISVRRGGRVVRLFSALAPDLCARSINAASYAHPHPNIPPFEPWPAPPDGFKLRLYPMDPPDKPGRFGNPYRSTNLMANLFSAAVEARDPDTVSPHHHEDFEQCSLSLRGHHVHHIRWPWVPKKSIWREDEHLYCSAPSMTVIPPLAIHTTQTLPPLPSQGVDIFAPPRRDFSDAGWVLNAEDYPT